MTDPTVKVSTIAVHQRIRRKLATQDRVLKKNRRPDGSLNGKWFVVQNWPPPDPSSIVIQYADLTAAARDIGVLNGYEVIDDE